jgi:hypothetical protein
MTEPAEPARLANTRRFLLDMMAGRLDDAITLLSPEVVYRVPGRNPLAGVFHGPTEVRKHLVKLLSDTAGTYEILKWVDWLVGASHVSALQYAQAQGGGMIYRSHHLYLVQTDDNDLLKDILVLFENQHEADRFFSHLPQG